MLRFKEFEESWKKRQLSQIVGRLESGVSVNSFDGPIISNHDYGILKTSCISDGSFNAQENKKIIEEDITRAKLNPAKDSILVSRMNTPQLVGEVGYISCDYPNLFIPDRLWLIQTRDKLLDSTKWLNYQLTTPKLKNALTSIATGTSGSMKNIAQPNFLNLEVHTPALLEQTKIANFLTAVDEKIHLLTQKHDLLTQYKKGLMQKIFSQELRFKDDEGKDFPEWQEKALGDVGEIVTGKTPSTTDESLWDGDIQFVTPTDICEGKYQTNTARTVVEHIKLKVLPEGSIMFTCIASIGKMSLSTKPCITNQQINSLIPKSIYNNEYLYYALLNITEFIKSTQSSSTLPIINKTEFSKFIISIPSRAEQTKIANFLSSIDDKITSTQSQLQAVKQYKQGLLQQMFV